MTFLVALARGAAGLLGAVPAWCWIAATAALALAWQTHEARVARADAAVQIEARQRADADAKATHAALDETERRLAAQDKVVSDARTRAARDRASVAAADAAAGLLRDHVARLADRAASCDPAPADGGPSAADAARMLAELQRRADDRAGVLARIADERGAAGDACVRLYESLRE